MEGEISRLIDRSVVLGFHFGLHSFPSPFQVLRVKSSALACGLVKAERITPLPTICSPRVHSGLKVSDFEV